jgi:hypothetical protein
MLPTARFANTAFPPEAGGPIEVKEAARSTSGRLFQHEMPIEQYCLSSRQPGIGPINMTPPGLNHPHLRIAKVMDTIKEDVGRGNKVRIQDKEKFSLRPIESIVERSSFESDSILPVQNHGIKTIRSEIGDRAIGQLASLVSGVIQNLDFKFILWIVEFADRLQQPFDHMDFIIDGELDRDDGEDIKFRGSLRLPMAIFEIEIKDGITMNAIQRQPENHAEIADTPKQCPDVSMHIS